MLIDKSSADSHQPCRTAMRTWPVSWLATACAAGVTGPARGTLTTMERHTSGSDSGARRWTDSNPAGIGF